MKIALIGGGTMGLAFARAWLRSGVVTENSLSIIEALPERRDFVLNELGCNVIPISQITDFDQFDVLFLAIKPQDFSGLESLLRERLKKPILLISIMAGISLIRLRNALGDIPRLIRSMPNLAVQVGKGFSAYFAESGLSREEVVKGDELLSAGGVTLALQKEGLLDGVTALAGSGPAYLYYFINHLVSAGVEFGLTKRDCENMIYRTLEGALAVWRESEKSPQELQGMVTSKGGTTEAAIAIFTAKKVGESILEAVREAQIRSQELGKE